MLATSLAILVQQMQKFTDIMVVIGMPLAEEKTLGPGPMIEFLGMVLNFMHQLLQIPDKKKAKCLLLLSEMIDKYHAREKVTVCQVQRLVGHLNFISQALPAGRPFLASLYRLTAAPRASTKVVKAGHQRRLNKETVNDLKMFQHFLSSTSHNTEHTVPFMVRRATFADSLQLFTDSSFEAFGCCFQNAWAQGLWSETTVFHQDTMPNIALLKLFAIVMALELWALAVTGKWIILHSDSSATVGWLNRKRALIPAAMQLIRHLTLMCLKFQIVVKAIHLEGIKNRICDQISRQKTHQMLQENPQMDPTPTALPSSLWPPVWSTDDMINKDAPTRSPPTAKRHPKIAKNERSGERNFASTWF